MFIAQHRTFSFFNYILLYINGAISVKNSLY